MLKVVASAACLELLGNEFHTVGPLTQSALLIRLMTTEVQ